MERPDVRIPPILASTVPPRTQSTNYPAKFASRVMGREKRILGDAFGLKNFGVNLTSLAPGGRSSLKHSHSRQDEFIYVVEGTPTVLIDDQLMELRPGMCVGFPAGGSSHCLVNLSEVTASYLEIGDRNESDEVFYPDDDLRVAIGPDGKRRYEQKDGTPL